MVFWYAVVAVGRSTVSLVTRLPNVVRNIFRAVQSVRAITRLSVTQAKLQAMLYVSLNRCTASARASRQRTQILDILRFRAHYLNSTLGAKPRALVRLWFLLRRWRVDVFAFIVAVSGMARVRSVGVSAPRNPRDLCGHVHLEHAARWHGRHRRGYRSSTKEHGVVALGLIKCVKCDVRCTFNILYFSVERCIAASA